MQINTYFKCIQISNLRNICFPFKRCLSILLAHIEFLFKLMVWKKILKRNFENKQIMSRVRKFELHQIEKLSTIFDSETTFRSRKTCNINRILY